MDLRFPDDVETFRAEVHAQLVDWMADAHDHGDAGDLTGLAEDFERTLLQRAGSRGWLALHWPADAGGADRTLAHRAAFGREAAALDAPLIDTAVTLAGAPILRYGTDAQRTALLPPMVRGEVIGSIGYTEAQAGSDLSAIATSATRTGTGPDASWVIDGEKVLVTGAHKADWILIVARTDPDAPARSALSMFVVPLDAPGVSVTRVRTANDWTLGTVRFDAVTVPATALIGTPGRGFAQMAAALADERSGFFWVGWAEQRLADLLDHVRAVGADALAVPGAVARDHLARLVTDVALARALALRVVAAQSRGDDVTVAAALSKVFVTETLQRIASVGVALLGPAGLLTAPLFGRVPADVPLRGRFAYEVVERLHPTLSVGANEIQRDTIATRGLGLPAS